ncbi:MAG: 50S ribosomal protein L16 [Planctomycetota bacterium]|nr:MAG: 50S ribosomal protein L16 [Planctomycetota bacterium]
MLQPKRVKYRKPQRGKVKGKATRGNRVVFGEYGIQCMEHGWINSRQIEAGRIAARHGLKGSGGRIWIRIFPHKGITATPAETRMGKGKGSPIGFVAVVKPGTVMYEIGGVSEEVAKKALNRIAHKLPVKCKLVKKEIVE